MLVQIDLSEADLSLFESYEDQVLALLPHYGAKLEARLRSIDGRREVHLLHFPDASARENFRNDPALPAMQDVWKRCVARSTSEETITIS
jgi:uncharacterized protein (DUF1330 family)